MRIQPRGHKVAADQMGMVLNHVLVSIQNLQIKGIKNVSRALIHKKTARLKRSDLEKLRTNRKFGSAVLLESERCRVVGVDAERGTVDVQVTASGEEMVAVPVERFEQNRYQLFVEGTDCFKAVLHISGINKRETVSNNIVETAQVLGIEAAAKTIFNELNKVYEGHGLKVDKRHLMLVGDLMTYSGNVLGFSRHGMMGKTNKSVLTMASYEETVKHLYLAAVHGEETEIRGVSDSIIVGSPIPIGTGACSVLRDVRREPVFGERVLPKREPLLLGACPRKAMTNNDYIVTSNASDA